MQLGIGSYTYGWGVGVSGRKSGRPLSALDLLEKAIDFGVNLVQIGDNIPLSEFSTRDLEELGDQAAANDIKLETGARGLTEKHLNEYIELSATLNARLLRFVIDKNEYEPQIPEVTTIITNALPLLQKHNIVLGIENHDRLKASEFVALIEAVNDPLVGICLDSVNSMGAGEGLGQVVDALAPYTVNLHIKDFGIERLPHAMGFQIDGRPAGQGMLNVPWLLEKITPFGRCHTAVLEQWVVPENDLEGTVRKEEIWAEESMRYLKKYF